MSVCSVGEEKRSFFELLQKKKDKMRDGRSELLREIMDGSSSEMIVIMCINHCISWCKTL